MAANTQRLSGERLTSERRRLPAADDLARFDYRGATILGDEIHYYIYAANAADARRQLIEARIEIDDVTPHTERRGKNRRFRREDLGTFCLQLAERVRAGEPIVGAVLGLGRSTRHNLLREALTDVAVELRREGARPAAAFAARADVFPPAFLNIIRVGAKKGDISDVLAKYGEAQLRAAENIARCRGALYYPATIVVLASIILALMCYFILPKMEEFYDALLPLSKGELPLLTRGLLGLSRTLTSVPGLLAVGLAVALAVYFVRWARNDGREAIERASLRWPGVGPLARTFHAAQTVHLVAILVGAGVTPHEFLKEAAGSSINIVYRETLEAIREAFHVGGLDLQTAFAPYAFLFGDEFQGAVATGEKTGRLETQLASYANLLDARVQESVMRLSKLVEPLTLVAAGLVIGLIVIAAYLPLFTLIGQLSNAK